MLAILDQPQFVANFASTAPLDGNAPSHQRKDIPRSSKIFSESDGWHLSRGDQCWVDLTKAPTVVLTSLYHLPHALTCTTTHSTALPALHRSIPSGPLLTNHSPFAISSHILGYLCVPVRPCLIARFKIPPPSFHILPPYHGVYVPKTGDGGHTSQDRSYASLSCSSSRSHFGCTPSNGGKMTPIQQTTKIVCVIPLGLYTGRIPISTLYHTLQATNCLLPPLQQ